MARPRVDPRERIPSALTIAGLDPSGGAGLGADLRAFAAAGVWGAAACSVVTVQSTCGLVEAHPVAASVVRAQVASVLKDLDIRAMKSGALGSEENVRAVAELFAERREIPSVVDPVGAASRALGTSARLDGGASGSALWALVRSAALVTPNAVEAGALLGRPVRTVEEGRAAAVELVAAGANAVLVKGGHLEGGDRCVDWLAWSGGVVGVARRRRATPALHGTGCTLSALIAGGLARRNAPGRPPADALLGAVRWARASLDHAIANAARVGQGSCVLIPRPAGRRLLVSTGLRGQPLATRRDDR